MPMDIPPGYCDPARLAPRSSSAAIFFSSSSRRRVSLSSLSASCCIVEMVASVALAETSACCATLRMGPCVPEPLNSLPRNAMVNDNERCRLAPCLQQQGDPFAAELERRCRLTPLILATQGLCAMMLRP